MQIIASRCRDMFCMPTHRWTGGAPLFIVLDVRLVAVQVQEGRICLLLLPAQYVHEQRGHEAGCARRGCRKDPMFLGRQDVGIQACEAHALRLGPEGKALVAKNSAMHKGNALCAGSVLKHLLPGYGVQAVHYSVAAEQKLRQVLRIRCHFTRVCLHVRGHAKQAVPADKDLGSLRLRICSVQKHWRLRLLSSKASGSHRRRAPMPGRAERAAT